MIHKEEEKFTNTNLKNKGLTLARVIFLISVNWASVNLTEASEVSYQNLKQVLQDF